MSREQVREISTIDTKALKRFAALERQLVGSNPLFVSEIDADVIKRVSGKSNFFSEMECALFVTSNGNHDVARCPAKINRRYQRAKNEAVGFVGHFAPAADCNVPVQAMFEHAEDWCKPLGVTRVISPDNGAAVHGTDLLSTAFDEDPLYSYLCNRPYFT